MRGGTVIESEGLPGGVRAPELHQDSLLDEARPVDEKLIDVPPSEMGKIVVTENSISFIPQKFLRRLRMLWIQVMQRALDKDEELDWKKYFLLPVILFDSVATPDAQVLPLRSFVQSFRHRLLITVMSWMH